MDANMWNDILNMVLAYKGALIAGAGFVLVFFVLWIVFRGVRLWYWKVDVSQRALEKIDEDLNNIRIELNSVQREKGAMVATPQQAAFQQPVVYFTQPTGAVATPVVMQPVGAMLTPGQVAGTVATQVVAQTVTPAQVTQMGQAQPSETMATQVAMGQTQPSGAVTGTMATPTQPVGTMAAPAQVVVGQAQQVEVAPKASPRSENAAEHLMEQLQNLKIEEKSDKEAAGIEQGTRYTSRECSRDKLGRVYTREEIEASIKA